MIDLTVEKNHTEVNLAESRLKLTEIFYSLQGEARTVGIPTVFVRLTGCPLRCQYCDTAYAFTGGEWFSFADILTELEQYKTRYITITGGEPLAQKKCYELLRVLCDKGFEVSLETSGAITVADVDSRVSKVVDIKTPGSEEVSRNLLTNLEYLTPNDQVKFVICDRQDYDWAVRFLADNKITPGCEILFSPSHQQLDASVLADWIIADQIPVRFQLQLHKQLWGDQPGC